MLTAYIRRALSSLPTYGSDKDGKLSNLNVDDRGRLWITGDVGVVSVTSKRKKITSYGAKTPPSSGAAESLSADANLAGVTIIVQNPSGASGAIYVGGDSSVNASTGIKLDAGQSYSIDASKPSEVFVFGASAGLSARWQLLGEV